MSKPDTTDEAARKRVRTREKAKAVAEVLEKSAGTRVAANLFLDDDVDGGEIEARVQEIVAAAEQGVEQAAGKAGGPGRMPARIRRVSRLAKSVAIEADRDVLEQICRSDIIKTVLATEVEDILPRPRGPKGATGPGR